jgi:hypothetical protein
MSKSQAFETQYPTIHRFVEDTGWIEIGQNNMISAFVRAYNPRRHCLRRPRHLPQHGSRTPRLGSRDQNLSRRKRHLADIGESGALVYPPETPRFSKGKALPTTPPARSHPIPTSSG